MITSGINLNASSIPLLPFVAVSILYLSANESFIYSCISMLSSTTRIRILFFLSFSFCPNSVSISFALFSELRYIASGYSFSNLNLTLNLEPTSKVLDTNISASCNLTKLSTNAKPIPVPEDVCLLLST